MLSTSRGLSLLIFSTAVEVGHLIHTDKDTKFPRGCPRSQSLLVGDPGFNPGWSESMPGIPSIPTVEKQEGQRGEVTLPRSHSKFETEEGLEPRRSSLPSALHPHPSETFCREKLRTGWPGGWISALSPSTGRVPEIAGGVEGGWKAPDSQDMVTTAGAPFLVW